MGEIFPLPVFSYGLSPAAASSSLGLTRVPLSSTSACTSRWTETARRARTSWGGRSTWWGRCWRCSSAWSPCPAAWWGESESPPTTPPLFQTSCSDTLLTKPPRCPDRLRPQDTERRARLWKLLQSLLETYCHLQQNDQSFLVEVSRTVYQLQFLLQIRHVLIIIKQICTTDEWKEV